MDWAVGAAPTAAFVIVWAFLTVAALADIPYSGPDLCTPEMACPPGQVAAACDAQPTDRSRCEALEALGFVRLCREQGGWRWWNERYCGPADAKLPDYAVLPKPATNPSPTSTPAPTTGHCASGPEGFPAVLLGLVLLIGLRWREQPVVT